MPEVSLHFPANRPSIPTRDPARLVVEPLIEVTTDWGEHPRARLTFSINLTTAAQIDALKHQPELHLLALAGREAQALLDELEN